MTIDIPFVLNTEAFATYMIIEGVETGSRFDRLLSWIDEEFFPDSDLFKD